MEIITDSFNNITINQVISKLGQKYAEHVKIERDQLLKTQNDTLQSDYFSSNAIPQDLDEKDFLRVLEKFKSTDRQIRSHEQVHATIGQTTTPKSYNYAQGPEGKMYAVSGSVRLDTSIPQDPKAAQFKLDQIARAASGPADSSGGDNMIVTAANLNKLLIQQKGDSDASN